MDDNDCCPVWGTPARTVPTSRDGRDVDSARAGGRYFISGTAEAILAGINEPAKARLTTWLVDQRHLGVECPEITSTIIDQIKRWRSLSVHERAGRLLGYLQTRMPAIGDTTKIPPAGRDLAILAHSESVKMSEAIYLLDFLEKSNWIEEAKPRSPDNTREYTITPGGYSHLAELEAKVIDSAQAFVAMWFDSSLDDAYNHGIAQGIADAGYKQLRIDQKDHNNKIDDEIIAEIRRSKFLVADFTQGDTGARGGVYYEAGFAHGLNIPVIFTCREDAVGKVHFDTRQYNHILWTTPDELCTRLSQRIVATIGDGPFKNKI